MWATISSIEWRQPQVDAIFIPKVISKNPVTGTFGTPFMSETTKIRRNLKFGRTVHLKYWERRFSQANRINN